MERCPTCNAKLNGARVCRRCKTDLNKALAAADQAEEHFRLASKAWSDGRMKAMVDHAKRSVSLHRTVSSKRLLACSALLEKDYRLALTLWAGIQDQHKKWG